MSGLKDVLPIIRSEFGRLKIPASHQKIYKDECVYSFDSPFSDSGLYVNLTTLNGVGSDFLNLDSVKSGSKLYLHQKWNQIPKEKHEGESEPTKLAIGIEGGFIGESQFDVVKEHALVIVTKNGKQSFPLPDVSLPEFISNICQAIIDNDGMKSKMQVDTWEATEERIVSKYALTLEQENNGKKISNDPSTWRCEASGDSNNLWLNLSTGYIGGGRKNWDGSGGSGAALDHFVSTGKKYPLCVKLGTITPHGADVWSYAEDEDCLVLDPLLAEHLAHWGVDVMRLEKTEKSLAELEVDMNATYRWTRVLEGGRDLLPLYGPGYVGLHNVGSTCYMNSVLQALLAIPEVQQRYLHSCDQVLASAPDDPAGDFITQLSKLACGVLSARYAAPAPTADESSGSATVAASGPLLEKYVVAPRMFKQVVSKSHREFSSSRQQDASEYFQHLLQVMERAERTGLGRLGVGPGSGSKDTPNIFRFELEQRIQDGSTGRVKYSSGAQLVQNLLELRIPLDQAVSEVESESPESKRQRLSEEKGNDGEEKETVKVVPFSVCIDSYFAENSITFRSSEASQSVRFKTFPPYLVVKLGRYYVDAGWVPRKVDASVPVPELLDLRHLRASGLQIGEEPMAEEAEHGDRSSGSGSGSATGSSAVVVDEALVMQLMDMGFSENGCRRALMATNNAPVEVAMGWVFEHMEDPDFNEPLPAVTDAGAAGGNPDPEPDPEAVATLASLGYSEAQARKALKATGNDLERAADWLFSHPDDTGEVEAEGKADPEGGSAGGGGCGCEDGEGVYRLFAAISHLGRSTDHGHYVCHVRKDVDGQEQWVLYNDDKVAQSQGVSSELGFMYFFQRVA